jgi:hypothetical protein
MTNTLQKLRNLLLGLSAFRLWGGVGGTVDLFGRRPNRQRNILLQRTQDCRIRLNQIL